MTFRTNTFILAASMFLVFAGAACAADALHIKTDKGEVQGKLAADGKGRAFLGIPFAAPPVGPLRWKRPQPAAKWEGVKQATSFGSRCMQGGEYPDMIFHDPGASEDCLTLNVWTPAPAKNQRLPVMVWIYGGGFTTGGTSEARQDGQNLAKNGVIVVSMNYRLSIFGFFAHHELRAESPQNAAGNYGLMDEMAALQWVQRNIAAFGGDPHNVTIFGESAGSFAVSAQMASPLAQGLFNRAIGESGGAFSSTGLSFPSLEVFEKRCEEFAQTSFGKTDLRSLRELKAEDLLKAARAKRPEGGVRFGPNVDGYFLPDNVPAIYAAGKQAHVPLLAGWNKDEGANRVVNAREKTTVASWRATAEKDYGAKAEDFLKVYGAATDEEALRAAEDLAGDRFIAYSTWAWVEAHVKTGKAPVYRYIFDRGSPGDPNHSTTSGAFHSDEIEYVFGVLDSRKGAAWAPEDYKLSELTQRYWTNFAKTGDPNGASLPHWPRYDESSNWQVMHLDAVPGAKPDQHRDRYLFLRDAPEATAK
ncbi:MAG: carboxylesterase family protein [Candidatus Acidiferrum sp.]